MADDEMMRLMEERHSVRRYRDEALDAATAGELRSFIDACNEDGGLDCRLVTDSPGAFDGILSKGFSNVRNYIVLVRGEADSDENVGYHGERMVLEAQRLGLNTCWVALTYSRRRVDVSVPAGSRIVGVIAVGRGVDGGVPHRSRPMEDLCACPGEMPDWFRRGMEAVMLAPSAMNRQRFMFTLLEGGTVRAESTGGRYSGLDLGIARLHFELGAGRENFRWEAPGSNGGPGGGRSAGADRDRMKGAGPSSTPRPTATAPENGGRRPLRTLSISGAVPERDATVDSVTMGRRTGSRSEASVLALRP